jgi:sirohydrochlorin cobaltochelatase
MPAKLDRPGLLLVGHGTRSPVGTGEFLALAGLVGQRLAGVPVEPAFLEMNEPSIRQALARLFERGARQVVVVPLLLFAAGHAKRDIPAAVEAAIRADSQFVSDAYRRTTLADHLGCSAAILELSRLRFTQSLQGLPPIAAERTCLVLVGRGSHDESAIAEMHHFAELRAGAEPLGGVEVAFLAMAQPQVQDVLPQLAARDWQRIVVQPHLLFHGDLYDALARRVQALAAQYSQQQWLLTPYLGEALPSGPAAELLVAAILQRFGAAAIRVVAPPGDG